MKLKMTYQNWNQRLFYLVTISRALSAIQLSAYTAQSFTSSSKPLFKTSIRPRPSSPHLKIKNCNYHHLIKIPSNMTKLRMKDQDDVEKDSNPLDKLNLPSPLILGSGSFTRKLILKEMNIPFHLLTRSIDERKIGNREIGSDPKELVLLLAKAKGEYLVEGLLDPKEVNLQLPSSANDSDDPQEYKMQHDKMSGHIVLTADQVVTHEQSILEKPDNIQQAQDFILKYSHSPPSTVGAVVLTHIPTLIQVSGVDTATIRFKPSIAQSNLISRLMDDDAPILSCAGGLMIEHDYVQEYIDNIDGTVDSVMGLSKNLVLTLLEEMKEKLLEHSRQNNI